MIELNRLKKVRFSFKSVVISIIALLLFHWFLSILAIEYIDDNFSDGAADEFHRYLIKSYSSYEIRSYSAGGYFFSKGLASSITLPFQALYYTAYRKSFFPIIGEGYFELVKDEEVQKIGVEYRVFRNGEVEIISWFKWE
ncbi:MAG: hypothetical protein KGZ96_01160 [Clostridia bacterium]|nr:hypothetical protein [Clostridia bacterium]